MRDRCGIESFKTLPYFRRMRHLLLAALLVFLAAANSAMAGPPDIERARIAGQQQSISTVLITQSQAGEPAEKCCMKEQIETSSSQSVCNSDCTYLIVDVDILFSGAPKMHDRVEHPGGAPVSCRIPLRPPIV